MDPLALPEGPAAAGAAEGRPSPRRLAAYAAAGAVALVVVCLAVAAASGPLDVDIAWYDAMVAAEAAWLVAVADVFDLVGSSTVMLPFCVAVTVWLGGRRQWRRMAVWAAATLSAWLAMTLLKELYGRERPPLPLDVEPTSAFPSGHSTLAATVGLTVALLLVGPGRRRQAALAVAAVYALLMASSRTYLRAHWLTDVTGGLLLGTVVALAALAIGGVARRGGAEP